MGNHTKAGIASQSAAELHSTGQHVPLDPIKSSHYLQQAIQTSINSDNPFVLLKLARLFSEGRLSAKDEARRLNTAK